MPTADPDPPHNAGSGSAYRGPRLAGLFDLLDEAARSNSAARALIIGERRTPVTFRQLAALVADLAGQLTANGLRPGERIALQARNGLEFVVGLLAASRARLVISPLDPTLATRERVERLAQMQARILLVDSLSAPSDTTTCADDTPNCPHWVITVQVSADAEPPPDRKADRQAAQQTQPRLALALYQARPLRPGGSTLGSATREDHSSTTVSSKGSSLLDDGPDDTLDDGPDDALILFTSGTTDQPKMVPLTHGNVAAAVRGICSTYEFGPDDATVATMPFFHGHGLLAGLLSPLASGGRVLIPAAGRFTAHTFWDDARAVGATWVTSVPTIYQILLERAASEYPGPDRCPLRFLRSCSAPLNPAAARSLQETFHTPVLCAYGMTETTHQAASQPLPRNGVDRAGSVGCATGTTLRIVDGQGRDAPVGHTGQVWVRGPTVTRGYLDNALETARSFTDGWFHTGDLGVLDEDGCLTLTGRIKELINRGGEKISPARVEAVLGEYPGVLEAAVFGVPDPKYGERVAAAVVARPEVIAGQLLASCREHLAKFEVPDSITFVTELPHTPKGALDRRAVAARFASQGTGSIASSGAAGANHL